MNTAIMVNWSLVTKRSGYAAPELARTRLQGEILNDKTQRFPNGMKIITSTLQRVIDCGIHKTVETQNTRYKIFPHDIDPVYEEMYPDAFMRLQTPSQGEA
jgi:hypothetical protein